MDCPKCAGDRLELLRYQRGQRRITVRCKRCGTEFETDAAALGRAMKRMSQEYYKKSRSLRSRRGNRRCRGCGH